MVGYCGGPCVGLQGHGRSRANSGLLELWVLPRASNLLSQYIMRENPCNLLRASILQIVTFTGYASRSCGFYNREYLAMAMLVELEW